MLEEKCTRVATATLINYPLTVRLTDACIIMVEDKKAITSNLAEKRIFRVCIVVKFTACYDGSVGALDRSVYITVFPISLREFVETFMCRIATDSLK